MPPMNAKNSGLGVGDDLGLGDMTLPGDEADDEEEKKKKLQTSLAAQKIQQALGNPGTAALDLGLGA
jgi:hypothetical protein